MTLRENIFNNLNEPWRFWRIPKALAVTTYTEGHYAYTNSTPTSVHSQFLNLSSTNKTDFFSFFESFSNFYLIFQKLKNNFAKLKLFETEFHDSKDYKMSNRAYIGEFDTFEVSKLQKTSKNFKNLKESSTRIYRSTWAKNFILKQNLQVQNFTKSEAFKNLSSKDQQAIRYQMRKIKFRKKTIQTKPKEKVKKIPFLLQATTIAPIALTEGMVITLSKQFYLLLGLPGQLPLCFALAAELFFMLSSALAKTSKAFKVLSCSFLAYSIFTVAYSTYRHDSAVQNFVLSKKTEQRQKELALTSLLDQAKERLYQARNKKAHLQKSLDVYIKHDQVTKGYRLLGERLKDAEKERFAAYEALQAATRKRASLKNFSHVEIFSMPVLAVVNISTWILIIGFMLLQVSTALYMRHALEALKYLVPKNFFNK
jgi:hypothetical protein